MSRINNYSSVKKVTIVFGSGNEKTLYFQKGTSTDKILYSIKKEFEKKVMDVEKTEKEKSEIRTISKAIRILERRRLSTIGSVLKFVEKGNKLSSIGGITEHTANLLLERLKNDDHALSAELSKILE